MADTQTRILCVDDEADNLRLYRALLEKYVPEAEIITAEGGESALVAVKETPPDIILLDARMPDMDGFEVCKRVKTDPETANIPVLMVSGAYVQPHHQISGFEGGADGYLCKPFKNQELAAQVRALLDKKKDRGPAFRIMVVDDSRTSREIIIAELKRNPHVAVASFGAVASALSALDAVKPDFIVCDAIIPRMSGFEFCTLIRQHPTYKDVPLILLCEEGDEQSVAKAYEVGASEVFSKPFKPFEMAKYISRHIDLRIGWFDHDVLIVDAAPVGRKILQQYLTSMRLRVHEAGDTTEAQEILRTQPIDLIILDRDLPGESGVEWCGKLKTSEETKWIPVLGLSSDRDLAISFINAGANDVLSRELLKEEIAIRTKNLLRQVSLTKQLQKAIQNERALNQHKNRLLGTAAHDIRAPITAISHYAELLLEGPVDDKEIVKNSLVSIHDLARHSLELLNKILDVSSIQSGVVELQCEVLAIDKLLAERLSFMNEMGKQKGITGTLENRLAEGVTPHVNADGDRLTQVIDNLLSNAVKYSPRDSTYKVSLDQEVEGWLIEVQDNGPGIPRDELFGVFDEFGRTSVQTTGGERRTGLGLAITKHLVELHGGTIWIDSEVGKGTTVSFVLPRHA